MRQGDLIPLGLVAGIGLFVAIGIVRRPAAPPPPAAPAAAAAEDSAPGRVQTQGVSRSAAPAGPAAPVMLERRDESAAPVRDDAAIRNLLEQLGPGTYIDALLAEDNRLLSRWPDRRFNALRVWIERDPQVAGWRQEYYAGAARAFEEWRLAGFPLAFDVIVDSVGADIKIRWVERFPSDSGDRIGVTSRMRDQHGWIRSADIVVATHDQAGQVLPPHVMAGVARHEVGHALGLGHSPSPGDVMFPRARTTEIGAKDRATLHLLYRLPPGVVQ